ncbi:site-specific integrase [Rhodovulum sp. PH10]|uniref:site-specific integrase n=1 Tax=Rhodovulum sp. PH10 TaxID=1187851 RepID=UPI0006918A23|nr:site-specific integrase [Rhodovulum sp. PH10]
MPLQHARNLCRDWESEIETRITNLRAKRDGGGHTLTVQQARALAGEWYRWFTERQLERQLPASHWEAVLGDIGDEVQAVLVDLGVAGDQDPDVWEESPEFRERLRPVLADVAETSRFLAHRKLALDETSRGMFLDFLYRDMAAGLRLLIRRAKGDYSPDEHPKEFPEFERTPDPGLTPWALFEQWIAEKKPATSTVDRWRGVFVQLREDFPDRSAGSISPEDAQEWIRGLPNDQRSPQTVRDVWLSALKTVFNWGVASKLLTKNPFTEVSVTVPRRSTSRETKAFLDAEVKVILSASLAIEDTTRTFEAAKRWVPWVCAYTGARAGEITQLRGVDVIERDGIHAIRITPEAGTVKTGHARVVPLHEHLLAQGFLEFVRGSGEGPLFYNEGRDKRGKDDLTNPSKPRYVKTRERLAAWVRSLGVTDPELRPNHAWRHTFKQIADRCGISERVSDAITGHAPTTVGREYGAPTLGDMAKALERFPRYET